MDVPLEIAFHHVDHHEPLEEQVRKEVERLERYFDHINSCRVVVERPENKPTGKDHGKPYRYRVRVELGVPNDHLVATKTEAQTPKNQDITVGIRRAFDAIERQLKTYVSKIQHKRGEPVEKPVGHVMELEPTEGFGFIRSADGRQIYFRKEAVKGKIGFDELEVGQEVHFDEIPDEPNPKATHVRSYKREKTAGMTA